ncbi:MAG: single-stranded DNA-binding protein [Acidaminococcaceae bacterium]|nr:single-stranded DNA-binding protein [Acidaminococcaceae bacterium]
MNKVFLLGRLTKDPEVRYTTSGKIVAQFTIAVDRPYTNAEGQKEADFFPIVIWGKSAETAGNSLTKGQRVLVEGRVQIRSYDAKDGTKRWITEVIADRFEFIERRDQWDRNRVYDKPAEAGFPVATPSVAAAAPSEMSSFGTAVSDDDKIPF